MSYTRVINPVDADYVDRKIQEIINRDRNQVFEDYIKFFIRATGQKIEDLMLVQQIGTDKIHYWLERKDGRPL